MRSPSVVMNTLRSNAAKPDYKYERLYRNLFNQEFLLMAYNNIYAKPGNMTKGTDGVSKATVSVLALVSSSLLSLYISLLILLLFI